jgi:hypothetical protein
MLGDYSIKEILVWIGGMLVAAALIILGVIYAVDTLIAPPNPADPLSKQRGLNADKQDVREK